MNFDFLTLTDYYDIFGMLLELILVELFFSTENDKRKHFFARFIGGGIIYALATVGLYVALNHGLLNLLRYFLIWGLSIIFIYFLFEISIKESYFICLSSYCIQHIAISSALLVCVIVGNYQVLFIVRFSLFVVVASVLTSVAKKTYYKNNKYQLDNMQWLVISSVILATVVIMNYLPIDSVPREYHKANILFLIYTILCSSLAFYIEFDLLNIARLNTESALIKGRMKMDREHYALSKEAIDIINIKSHDLKKQVNLIRHSLTKEDDNYSLDDALNTIEQAISDYNETPATGSEAIDILLTEKILYCKKQNIQLKYLIDGTIFDFMNIIDLYSVLGNVIDNAIEATLLVSEPGKRLISIQAKKTGSIISLHCENYFDQELKYSSSGNIQTTKPDSKNHGYGLKSIEYTLKKYNGNIEIETDNDIFITNIIINQTCP